MDYLIHTHGLVVVCYVYLEKQASTTGPIYLAKSGKIRRVKHFTLQNYNFILYYRPVYISVKLQHKKVEECNLTKRRKYLVTEIYAGLENGLEAPPIYSKAPYQVAYLPIPA